MKVTVEQYNERWPNQFEVVAADLRDALAALNDVRIEHVGSTAVPGLAAKPIIDIDVIVKPDMINPAIGLLGPLGYRAVGERGIEGRVALDAPDDEPRRHVYVCRADSLAVKNHLAVRETLRKSDELRDEYCALKLSLAQREFRDMDEYVFAKTRVLQKILARSGLTAVELAEIEAANS